MGIPQTLFINFCFALTAGLIWTYSYFTNYFNDGHELRRRITILEEESKNYQFQAALAEYQLKDLQQSTLALLPNSNTKKNWAFNNFKSALRTPSSLPQIDLSSTLFERGKKLFAAQKYEMSIREFEKIKTEFPLSAHLVETYFFIGESYFLQKDFKNAIQTIEDMVTQFPDSELTGFILLRMGQISEYNNQPEVAAEIYQAIQQNFRNKDLIQQAYKMAQKLNLQ